MCDGVSLFYPPPLIFIGVKQGIPGRQSRGAMRNRLQEFTRSRHEEAGGEGLVSIWPNQWFGRTLATAFGHRLWPERWQVGPKDGFGRLGAVLRQVHALVGSLIHGSLNDAF
jgi:hypothetical protein